MKVRTVRIHTNSYGGKFEKRPGDVYNHPSPTVIIDSGIVEPARRKAKAKA